MPIKWEKICKHCKQPINQIHHFGDWFHTGREDTSTERMCDPTRADIPENNATPTLKLVKRGKQ
jgi:hypothetical protein